MPEKENSRFRIGWLVVLLMYVAVLAFFVHRDREETAAVSQVSVFELEELRSMEQVSERLGQLGLHVLVRAARFLPLGVFLALSFPRRRRWFSRLFVTLLPASAFAILLSTGLLGFELGSGPGLRDLALPSIACVLGARLGTSASRGFGAFLLFFPKLALLGLVVAGLGLAVAYLTTSTEPLELRASEVSSEKKRELVRLFRGSNPTKLNEGETRKLTLTNEDLDVLVAWGLSVAGRSPRVEVNTRPSEAILQASARLPVVDRYGNLVLGIEGGIDRGELELALSKLSIGGIDVPGVLLAPISAVGVATVESDRTLRPILEGIEQLRLDDDRLTVTYGPMDIRGEVLPGLVSRLGPEEAAIEAARAQIRQLGSMAPQLASGDDRFGAVVESAFTLAKERSAAGDPVIENSGALLALASVLGHPRLRVFSGLDSDDSAIADARRALGTVTLRGRADWTQHFFVSAGLTQLSWAAVSDAAGALKEELDADTESGGSGFSFSDLLADRAGTLFARVATLDADRARALQDRLEGGFRVDAFFPRADDLPEGIPDSVLQYHYGGVGGAEYERVIRRIEGRLERCGAYR